MSCFLHFLVKIYAVVVNVSSPAVTTSRRGCATSCFRNTTCSTFFFNEESSSCYLVNRWIENLQTPGTPSNMYYFVMYPDTCNFDGYRFIRKVSLCLRISLDQKPWENARADCQSEGAQLIKIDTEEKDRAIMDILTPDYFGLSFYTGGHDPNQQNNWKWTDGSPVEYTRWAPEEPNNLQEQCLLFQRNGHGWNDVSCDTDIRYICEKVIN